MRSVLAAAAVVIAMTSSAFAADLAKVRAWRVSQEREIVRQLADYVAIPSVAADPKGLQTMADRLQGELAKRGFETRQLSSGAGDPPSVFGSLSTPGAKRTVVFYAHYDGQPVTPSQWRTDPFRPVMRTGIGDDVRDIDWQGAPGPLNPEWRLFGRGASDDKSAIVAFLAAFDALTAGARCSPPTSGSSATRRSTSRANPPSTSGRAAWWGWTPPSTARSAPCTMVTTATGRRTPPPWPRS